MCLANMPRKRRVMAKRKIVDQQMDQQSRVANLADKHLEQFRKEGVTIEELNKILYRVRKMASAGAKV